MTTVVVICRDSPNIALTTEEEDALAAEVAKEVWSRGVPGVLERERVGRVLLIRSIDDE